MGPLAHWQVSCRFDLSNLPGGHERALLLYPLPPQSALSACQVRQQEPLGPEPEVRTLEELSEGTAAATPSSSMLETFGKETLPILSLALDPYLAAYEPGHPLELQLTFSTGLPTVDGRIRLAIPGRVAKELVAQGPDTAVSFQVELEDADELVDEPIANIEFTQSKQDDLLTLQGKVQGPTTDLKITFRPGRTEMPVTRLRRGDSHFIFSIFPPTSIPASPQRRDLVFAVDASENVLGGLFESIRDDLCEILRALDDNDRFALVVYGRDIDGYRNGDLCDVAEVEQACQWLHTVEPKGRADVQPLLASIQALPSEPERQLCIFLLAAGHVGNEPAILKSLDFDQSDRRYYAVGLGPSVQQAFLRRLALLTRGRCEVAADGDCAEALRRLLGQTRALLAEVTFEQPDGNDTEIDMASLVPSRMTSLTPEGPVHCLGIGTPESIRFRSKDETGVFFAGTVNARATTNPALEGVWAGLRVREILDSVRLSAGAKRKQLRAEAAALAREHGILAEDTVLVLESDGGLDVQLSALPYRWRKVARQVAKTEEEATPAFDWRKGLKARDGLFKGGRMPGQEGETDGVRHGLRSRGTSGETLGKMGAKPSKPMLDRYSMGAGSSSAEEVEPGEEIVSEVFASDETEAEVVSEASAELVVETEAIPVESELTSEQPASDVTAEVAPPIEQPAAAGSAVADEADEAVDKPAPEPDSVVELAPPVVAAVDKAVEQARNFVPVVGLATPVVSYSRDPLGDAKLRMASYVEQAETVEARLALSALAGMPREVTAGGPDLPRILAQTVGHLEKRGYYSAAVSVLGLLLREYPSLEVTKKMESLLIGWANSLSEEYLPEAIHILGLGGRVCPGSELLDEATQQLHQRWSELAAERRELPAVSTWMATRGPEESFPSSSQLELFELRQKQDSLTAEVAALRTSLEEKVSALPGLLEKLLESRPVAAAPTAVPAEPPSAGSVAASEVAQPAKGPVAQSAPTVAKPSQESSPVASAPVEEEPLSVAIPLPTEGSQGTAVEPVVLEPAAPDPEAFDPALAEEDSGEGLNLTKDELLELLQAEPKDVSGHRAVKSAFPDAKDRINFYRDLVRLDPDQPSHSLALARAYKDADQTKVAVVHYQKYLRSEKDRQVYLELADAYDELGKTNLSVSARKAAELLK